MYRVKKIQMKLNLVESAGEFTNEIFKSAIRTIQFYSECQAKN